MNKIKEQILDELGDLPITTNIINDVSFRKTAMRRFLTSKEVRHVPQDKKEEMFEWNPSVLFPDYEEFYRSLDPATECDSDYSNLSDGHNISELFCESHRFRVTPDYLKYIKSSNDGFTINVYGGENTMISKDLWNFTDSPEGRSKFANKLMEPYQFSTPDTVVCTSLDNTSYWDNMLIETCRNYISVLAIDLPNSYYSAQIIKGSIFTWDIVAEKYQVGGLEISEINKRINEIAANGFLKPLVMRIDEGCLTPIDDDTAIDMFIATYLDLPTIPVALYMSDEDVMKNRVMEELHDCIHSNMCHDPAALDVINNICKPYFFFELAEAGSGSVYMKTGLTYLHKNQYPSMNNINDPNIVVYNRHLDKSAKVEEIVVPMTAEEAHAVIEEANKKLMAETLAKIQKDNDEINRKILAGEY